MKEHMNLDEALHTVYQAFQNIAVHVYPQNTFYEWYYAEERLYVIWDLHSGMDEIIMVEANNPQEALWKVCKKNYDFYFVYVLADSLGQYQKAEKKVLCYYDKKVAVEELASLNESLRRNGFAGWTNELHVKKINRQMIAGKELMLSTTYGEYTKAREQE